MKIEIKIIHKEWNDNIILDFTTKRLYRVNIEDEYGDFTMNNNILYVKWDRWDSEIFISIKDNIFYIVEESKFYNDDWTDICYIDNINNIIYRKSNNEKGYLKYENDELIISWTDKLIKNNLINNISNYELSNENTLNENTLNENTPNENTLNENTPNENTPNENTPNENTPNKRKIPNIIHFVFGLKEQESEFELYRYIAIKSAYDVNKPDKIYFYYYYEPYGYWWNKVKAYITLVKIIPPTEIFGNKLHHYAHQADIIRLQKLIEHGGIYLDMDTYPSRN